MPKYFRLLLILVAAGALLWTLAPAQRGRKDYLSKDLRKRVEQLKKDVKREPTSLDNLAERSGLLFDWINAFSLTGRPSPVNATSYLRSVAIAIQGTDDDREALVRSGLSSTLDEVIAEYTLKDEHPNAAGHTTVPEKGPFEAATWITFTQVYHVGSQPLKAGGMLILGKQQISDHPFYQLADPASDNYVSAKASNPSVKLEPDGAPLSGMHGGFRGAIPVPAYRIAGGDLKPGDTVTFVYGDRSGGSRGYQSQTIQSAEVIHPIYVDLGDGLWLTPAWDSYQMKGGEAVSVRTTAPSVVATGEAFDVALRSEDKFYNRATTGVPAYNVSLGGSRVATVDAGAAGLSYVRGQKVDQPGVYRFRVESADGKISGLSNPVWVQDDPEKRLYWGETHVHTAMAEGQGTIDYLYDYAREDAQIDFVGFSEHDIWLDDREWETLRESVKKNNEPGKFVSFLAYEWTQTRSSGGHHNVFFREPTGQRMPVQKYPFLTRLYQGLRSAYDTNDVLIVPHAHQAGDWRLSDPEMETMIEIQSTHGTFEWFGNYYLRNGHQVGFLAASDNHRGQAGLSGVRDHENRTQFGGLAAVWAQEKTVDSIFDALKARSGYATAPADRIIVDVDVNGVEMGQRAKSAEERRIKVKAMGTAPITEAVVVKNGNVVYTKRPAAAALSSKTYVEVGFDSSSEPIYRDNPRGNRPWKGTLTVQGAKLVSAKPLNFLNVYREKLEVDPNDPSKLHFYVLTRGRADKVLLELDGATPQTQIDIDLEKTTEMGGAPVMLRGSREMEARQVRFLFSRLSNGRMAQHWPVDQARDTISVELVNPKGPMDYDFEYVDTGKATPGDYFYVRVTQLNGAQAWSSPVWVGGEAPR